MKIIKRLAAAAKGKNKFFTGRECRKGHVAERWVCNGNCIVCERESSRNSVNRYRDRIKAARPKTEAE